MASKRRTVTVYDSFRALAAGDDWMMTLSHAGSLIRKSREVRCATLLNAAKVETRICRTLRGACRSRPPERPTLARRFSLPAAGCGASTRALRLAACCSPPAALPARRTRHPVTIRSRRSARPLRRAAGSSPVRTAESSADAGSGRIRRGVLAPRRFTPPRAHAKPHALLGGPHDQLHAFSPTRLDDRGSLRSSWGSLRRDVLIDRA